MSNDIYIVYETTNLVNGKFYIGYHGICNKNYLGSGTILEHAIKKHGRDNFMRETLKEFPYKQDALDFEELIVDDKMVLTKNCYNLTVGGGCPPTLYGEDNGFYGMSHSDEVRKRMSESMKGRIPWIKGRTHKPESNDKNAESHRRLSNEEIKECIKLCLDGMLIKDIAKRYDVCFQIIHRYLQKNDDCVKQMSINKKMPRNKLSSKQVEEVIEMRKMGKTYKEIGNIFGITRQTVSKYINLGGK